MRKLLALLLTIALALTITACSAKPADGWQEEIDKGVAAVEAQDYETAITAFEAAITIDPLWEEAYSRLSDTYLITGDIQNAVKTLASASENLKDGAKLKEEALTLKNNSIIYIDGETYELDENGRVSKIHDTLFGSKIYTNVIYDENGSLLKTETYDENNELSEYSEYTYNDNGLIISRDYFYEDGEFIRTYTYKYDENNNINCVEYEITLFGSTYLYNSFYNTDGLLTETYSYNPDGTLVCYYKYDENGNWEEVKEYAYDDALQGKTCYEKIYNGDYEIQKLVIHNVYVDPGHGVVNIDMVVEYENGKKVSALTYSHETDNLLCEVYYNESGEKISEIPHNEYDFVLGYSGN